MEKVEKVLIATPNGIGVVPLNTWNFIRQDQRTVELLRNDITALRFYEDAVLLPLNKMSKLPYLTKYIEVL